MVNKRKRDLSVLFGILIAIIVINFISSFYFTRFDFTADKRYTLSNLSHKIASDLNGDLQITVYLDGDLPAGFRRLKNETNDLLLDLASYSHGKIHVDFVNPAKGDEKQQQENFEKLAAAGIEPTNLSVKTEEGLTQKIIFPEALITYHDQQIPVRLLQNRMSASPDEVLNNSIQNLEYAFVSAIEKVVKNGKPLIGFVDGHRELNNLQLSDAMTSLQDGFDVGRVDLKAISLDGLRKLKLLVIAKPDSSFSEADKFKIDYFVMNGGRILWAIDNVNAELDSLQGHGGQQLAFPKKLNLDDILFNYGIRINYNLIADMNCAQIPLKVGNVGGQSQMQMVPWLFYPIFIPTSQHPIVKNLDGIRSEFASTIDTIGVKGIKKQVILASSPYSRAMIAPGMISLDMVNKQPDPRQFKNVPLPVAVLSEGVFPSDFKNRQQPEGMSEQVQIPEKSIPTKMVFISDGDVLKSQVSSKDRSPFPLGYDRYTQQQYGNRSLLLNIVDYLTDDSGIIELRNKEVKLRLLDKARVRDEKLRWQLINLLVPLSLLVVAGLIQAYLRKRKYAA
ncbi:gliding motility-associated ABC transporter substrate-binding protein GldG [Pedobacter sp. HMF7647]|uniref:Gliding motility-associated ABC transporter substrate-binding protein GldG n=1 Tax=Hufsiella arboris TaxID=2695275 RepID=A0A7K1YEA7_9SPHI|nr:gliding motility-associated ABC transporter substrate-binding protein GldG [Hufsiella arboris]